MIGAEGAAQRAATWIGATLPGRLRIIEDRLDVAKMADPKTVAAHETGPLGIEKWPAVFVLPQRMTRMEVADVTSVGELYRCTYNLRVLVWVRATDYPATDLLRKRYVLAVRETLLTRKQLAPPAEYGGPGYGVDTSDGAVDPVSMREDYSDVMVDEASRTIAGAWIDVDVTFTEALVMPDPIGAADSVTVSDTAALPPHPAL